MLHESVFRTLDLPAADRFEAWVERMGHTHAPMRLDSAHTADYHGYQRVIALGDVTVWPATFDQLTFHRTAKLVRRSDPESYHLSLLLRGEGVARWGRRQAVYRVNEFHTNSSSRAYDISTGPDPVSMVGLEIPRAQVPLPGDRADQVMGRRITARRGTGALLAQFLHQIAADTSAYRPADGPRLATVAADLVAAVFAHALDAESALPPETRGRTLTLRAQAFVRRRLGDPDLTPAAVAEAHHISRSHLYRLFQAEGLTVASYIRDQRLAHARRDLLDPAQRATPVHVVAARWGFPRAAEFSRAFRTAYGVPPGELRNRTHEGTGADTDGPHGGSGTSRASAGGDTTPTGPGRSANDTPRSSDASC
ncbi:helix-turn-helix domain-containing protein [Streptomyces sp. NPDC058417]|uniref:AraC-like ligand-binding domain-containing protein n=1 Tax=unclassified Streptomyces TaxID=2593676 RepID=UPI0036602DE3